MRRWGLILALFLSVGVNVGILAALATRRATRPERQPPPPAIREEPGPVEGQELDGHPRASRLADRLGLEGEPRRQFLDLQQRFFEKTVRTRLHMVETQREVRRELMSEAPDQRKIDTLLQDSARDFLSLEQALATNIVESRKLLDPEQEDEFLRVVARLRPQAGGFGPRPNQRPEPPPWRQDRRMDGGRRPPRDRFPPEDQRGDQGYPDDGPPPEDGPP